MIFVAVLMMTGCTKVKTNKLQGIWSTPPEYHEAGTSHWGDYYPSHHFRHNTIEFVNSNTLYFLGLAVDDPSTVGTIYNSNNCTPFPNHSGWYYLGNKSPYTYVFENNKVIVSNGSIYTYMDGKLYKEGSSEALSPW